MNDMLAMGSALLIAVIGMVWRNAGVDPGMRIHGLILLIASAAGLIYVLTHRTNSTEDRSGYFDGPVRVATVACVLWGVVGFLVGDIIAWQLAIPSLN